MTIGAGMTITQTDQPRSGQKTTSRGRHADLTRNRARHHSPPPHLFLYAGKPWVATYSTSSPSFVEGSGMYSDMEMGTAQRRVPPSGDIRTTAFDGRSRMKSLIVERTPGCTATATLTSKGTAW